MEMGAIVKRWGVPQAAVEAVLAGADAIYICHTYELQRATVQALLNALHQGRLTPDRLRASMERLDRVKRWAGLWPP
jgi:beta-N-acetylhexosaminidase